MSQSFYNKSTNLIYEKIKITFWFIDKIIRMTPLLKFASVLFICEWFILFLNNTLKIIKFSKLGNININRHMD